jgi:hypothetical protein
VVTVAAVALMVVLAVTFVGLSIQNICGAREYHICKIYSMSMVVCYKIREYVQCTRVVAGAVASALPAVAADKPAADGLVAAVAPSSACLCVRVYACMCMYVCVRVCMCVCVCVCACKCISVYVKVFLCACASTCWCCCSCCCCIAASCCC